MNNVLNHLIEINEHGTTEDLNEAYYILSDGTFLKAEYVDGCRCTDHSELLDELGLKRDTKGWETLHREYKVIRYVPEYPMGMIDILQELTEEQKQIIELYEIEIERY